MHPFDEEVLVEEILLYYADLDGTADALYGPAELEVVSAEFGPGPLGGQALVFDGVDDYAKLPINLTLGTIGTNAVTIERFLKKDAFANDDALEFEYGTNYNGSGGFMSDPNGSGGGWELALRGSSGPVADSFARPAAGQWHHLVTVFDVGAAQILHYLNGELVELTSIETDEPSGFNNNDLYLGSRAGLDLFSAQAMARLAIYAGELSAERVAAHYAAASKVPVTFSFFLSGGAANADPAASIGGAESSEEAGTDLLDDVLFTEAEEGDVEHRCIYVRADDGATVNATAYLKTPLGDGATLSIGAAAEDAGEEVDALEDDGDAPAGVTFESPESAEDAIDLGTIGPGEGKGLWLRREIDPATAPDFSVPWSVVVDGEPA